MGKTKEKKQEKLASDSLNWKSAEMVRLEKRTTIERSFARLKEEFGAKFVRVRGGAKVFTHLMFGVVVLAVDQMLRI